MYNVTLNFNISIFFFTWFYFNVATKSAIKSCVRSPYTKNTSLIAAVFYIFIQKVSIFSLISPVLENHLWCCLRVNQKYLPKKFEVIPERIRKNGTFKKTYM